MTIEEAVELVLRGGAWSPCPDCDGSGVVPSQGGGPRSVDLCMANACEGGFILDQAYAEACEMLDKEVPFRPPPIPRHYPGLRSSRDD